MIKDVNEIKVVCLTFMNLRSFRFKIDSHDSFNNNSALDNINLHLLNATLYQNNGRRKYSV